MRIRRKLDLNEFKKKWRYPLHAAIHEKNIDMFFALLADPNSRRMINELEWDSKRSPIYRAIIGGQIDMLIALLKKGAHLNKIQGIRRDTSPLLLAIRRLKRNLIKLLLFFGADMELACATGETPRTLLASQPETLRIFVEEIESGIETIKTTLSTARELYTHEHFIEAAEHYYRGANHLIELGEYGLERLPGDQLYPLAVREFDPDAETYGERTLSFYQGEAYHAYQAALEALQRAERQGSDVNRFRADIVKRMRTLDAFETCARQLVGVSRSDRFAPLLWSAVEPECSASPLMSVLGDPEERLRVLMSQREKASDKTEIARLDREIMLLAQHLEQVRDVHRQVCR